MLCVRHEGKLKTLAASVFVEETDAAALVELRRERRNLEGKLTTKTRIEEDDRPMR